nr:uncharacterized protein LOC128705054 [Cherax quadricarinatus]
MAGQKKKSLGNQDHVIVTINVVVLTNLLLDGPHMMVHLVAKRGIPSFIIHMVFYLHLVIDPVVFVGLNKHYQKALLCCLHTCLLSTFSTCFGNPATSDNPPTSDNIQRSPDTPL